MAEWISPIYDRTQSDVDFALSKIAEWKKSGNTNVYELKGCMNATDINRIENNIKYLSEHLSELYYFPHTTSKTWNVDGLPDINDINRIIQNIHKTISAFFQSNDAPNIPDTMLTYEQVNDIEKNLFLIKNILDNMVKSFRECGTFECGED